MTPPLPAAVLFAVLSAGALFLCASSVLADERQPPPSPPSVGASAPPEGAAVSAGVPGGPASGPSRATPTPAWEGPGKRYTTWDANLEGAFGRVFTDPAQWSGFGRARGGILWVRDPVFLSLGATYELSNLSAATIGVQGEWMNLEVGVWGQAGPIFDVAHGGRPGVMAALGWSIFGVEVQGRDMQDAGFVGAIYAKLRIPIGIIAFGFRGR